MNVQEISFPSCDGTFQLKGNLSLPKLHPSPPPPRIATYSNDAISTASANSTASSPIASTLPTQAPAPVPPSAPAILIISGSGRIDRDGNALQDGLRLNTWNRFAEHVTSRVVSNETTGDDDDDAATTTIPGTSPPNDNLAVHADGENPPPLTHCAVLSYDKRGVGKSINTGDKNLYYAAGMWDLVNDAIEAVRFLSNHPLIDSKRIILLGHSEGAILLPLICHGVDNAVNACGDMEPILGCIFYSGFGETIDSAMQLQRQTLLEEDKGWLLQQIITPTRLDRQYQDQLAKVYADDEPDYVSSFCGLVKHPAKWFREHMAYDFHKALREYITCHCLAITGCNDVQVHDNHCLPDRAAKLVPKAASIEVHRPEKLTHVLRCLGGPSTILKLKSDYQKMGKEPLDDELLSLTDNWCDRILNLAQHRGRVTV